MKESNHSVTFKGKPVTLVGPKLKVGDKAPDFNLTTQDFSTKNLGSFKGKTLLISVVPSMDTPVCEQQTRRFFEESNRLSKDIAFITISMDLPFAQKRACSLEGLQKVETLSDHRDASFGQNYGVLIKEMRLLARSIFVVGPDQKIKYVEYVPEVTNHPNYTGAIDSLKVKV